MAEENALKPIWKDAPVPDVGLDGDLITSRGTDPLIDTSGSSALDSIWKDPVPSISPEESENSVSGLPGTPNRYEPSEQPPPIPPLDRPTPGTIDKP